MPINNATNLYGVAKWIVDPVLGSGTHTTISSAIAAASSGDTIFIRTATYTEDPTLKAGVNLTAFDADAITPNVIINGKCTASFSGICTLSGICLQTNNDFSLSITGASPTVVYLKNCYINIINNNGIEFNSSGGAVINLIDCKGNIGNTGFAYFTCSGSGGIKFFGGLFENGSGSTTASTSSSSTGGGVAFYNCFFANAVTTSNVSVLTIQNCQFLGALIINGTGVSSCWGSSVQSGSDSAISIGTGATLSVSHCQIQSSNTNAITGTGELRYALLSFVDISSSVNTTTLTPYATLI